MEKVREMINKNFDTAIGSWKYLVEEDNLYLIGRLEECQNAKYTVNRMFEQYGNAYWDWQHDGTHFCSECGTDALWTEDGREFCSMYCPHCGRLMTKVVDKDE